MQSVLRTGSPLKAMRLLIAGLIVVSTLLFIAGVAIERGRESGATATAPQESQEVKATPTTSSASGAVSGEGSEGQEKQEASRTATPQVSGEASETHKEGASETTATKETHSSEAVFGLDIENPWILAAYVVGWLALLAGLFIFGRIGFALVIAAAGVALVFDIAEVMRQAGMSDTLVAAIAVLVAVCHAAIVALAILALTRSKRQVA